MEKSIYDMKLHEQMYVTNRLTIIRVPGGWLYFDLDSGYSTFVDYSQDFIGKKQYESNLPDYLK